MSVLTANMNLVQSTIGVDSGLNWEQNLNSSLTTIDQHNHTSGNGVLIPPDGLNINASLPFNNNQATGLGAVLFTDQASLATLNALYTVAGELFYNDPTGPVQITLGGSVNATTSGISSGSASAAFASGVLVVNAAANTPANIQVGSILLGNNVASSKFLTLAPPSAMAASYSLTLPSVPAQTNVMTIDSSGNMGSTTWNAVANNRTRATGATVGIGGIAVSSSCGNFSTSSSGSVTNLSVTITTAGNPVMVYLTSDGTTNQSNIGITLSSTNGSGALEINNGVTAIGAYSIGQNTGTGTVVDVPSSALSATDFSGAGTYTYTVFVSALNGTIAVRWAKLVAYEL